MAMNTDLLAAEAWDDISAMATRIEWKSPSYDPIERIKSAIEKAWREGYVDGSNYQIGISRAAHASEADDYVGINKIVKKHGEACRMAVIEAYELGKAPAHASEGGAIEDDNCFRCGRPLGWCEPQLCEECRALEDKPTPAPASELPSKKFDKRGDGVP